LPGVVAEVMPGSIAEELNIAVGDQLVRINGIEVEDIIDYRYYCGDEELELEIVRADGATVICEIEKDMDEDLGLVFTANVFDGIRVCHNRCLFCFVDQLPPNPRKTLLLKDDDYRMSFLEGNYITGTNLTEQDLQRIQRLRLSPLYFSVHATDSKVRAELLGLKRNAEILPLLNKLADAQIDLHTQIVLCPGLNDGVQLEKTIDDLIALGPYLCSIAIVPVGLTRYHQRGLRLYTPFECSMIIDLVQGHQKEFQKTRGSSLVFLADEFYLKAGRELPTLEHYEDLPQLENGVGMATLFLDQWKTAKKSLPHKITPTKYTIITGKSAEPIWKEIEKDLAGIDGLQVNLVVVANQYFGETVTVSGLLTGSCLIKALEHQTDTGTILIPQNMLKFDEEIFLDSITLQECRQKLNMPIQVLENDAAYLVSLIGNNRI